MDREEYLKQIARELYESQQSEKEVKDERSKLRKEFLRLYDARFNGQGHLLPVRTIEVPDSFWKSTSLTKEQFAETRFPGWKVEHCERNTATGMTVFVFKRDPAYVSGVVDVEDDHHIIRVSKEVAESTPNIDWETLQAERPDLYQKLAKVVVVLELDDAALERLAAEQPEELATLERHMTVDKPVIKAVPRRLKNG